jgi:hypothetical protein
MGDDLRRDPGTPKPIRRRMLTITDLRGPGAGALQEPAVSRAGVTVRSMFAAKSLVLPRNWDTKAEAGRS